MTNLASISDLFSLSTGTISVSALLICTICSLLLGATVAFFFSRGEKTSKSFSLTLVLLPAIVQMVIMLVNGDVGTGVAVMGAFGLVKFRSAPGSAKEICAIFLAMAAGLACGTQHLTFAILFTLIICGISVAFNKYDFLGSHIDEKCLKIVIPESLDYSSVFNDIFRKYTDRCDLDEVKTTNMGSLFKLSYTIVLKNASQEKALIDELRQRNGNLEISCGRPVTNRDKL
jgi:hypothetical protein